MIDVVHSVNLDQRLDFPHDQYFPNNTPATIATTTPLQASFGFDLPGEFSQTTSCVNNFFEIPNWTLIAAMTFQLSDQDININNSPQSNVSSSQQQQNSRQYNDMAATAFSNQYPHDTSVQQTSILPSPPFVEPSGNYIAISSATTNNTQTLPYGYPSSTLPTSNTQSINLEPGNHIAINSRNAYISNSTQQQQQQQHHHAHQHQHQHQQHHQSQQPQQSHHHQSRIEITNQLIPGYNFNPNQCLSQYQTSIPSTIGNNSHHHGNHQKQISRSINNFSRQDATTSLPISIAPNLFMQPFNNQTSNGSTMLVPLYDPSTTIFTAKPTTPTTPTISISQNSTPTSENTSPTKQTTYSYSGPPKSYYSRLPLYDRPFKCDQCPQSFNRNHDLKRHKRIHLAVKPYPCQYCEKQFSRKDALKRHVLVKGCNNTSNNNKKSNSNNGNNNNNKNVVESSSNSSISTTTIENYVDNGDQIKTEPTNDNGFGMSI